MAFYVIDIYMSKYVNPPIPTNCWNFQIRVFPFYAVRGRHVVISITLKFLSFLPFLFLAQSVSQNLTNPKNVHSSNALNINPTSSSFPPSYFRQEICVRWDSYWCSSRQFSPDISPGRRWVLRRKTTRRSNWMTNKDSASKRLAEISMALREFRFWKFWDFLISLYLSHRAINRRWRMGSGCSSIWPAENTSGGISRRWVRKKVNEEDEITKLSSFFWSLLCAES